MSEFHRQLDRIKSFTNAETAAKLQRVRESFIGLPIYSGLDGYPYSLFPLTDGPINPSLVEDMGDLIVQQGKFDNVDLIVSEADRGGGLLTHDVGCKTGISYTLANWYPQELPGVITVKASIGFSGSGVIAVCGIQPGQNTIFIDDLISSGGTAKAIIESIRKTGAFVNQAIFVGEKVNLGGREKIEALGVEVISIIQFVSDIENGRTTEV